MREDLNPTSKIKGVLPVFSTPFHQDESIDFETLKKEIDWLSEQGSDGVVMGMVPETLRLSGEEREQLAEPTRVVMLCSKLMLKTNNSSLNWRVKSSKVCTMAKCSWGAYVLIGNFRTLKDRRHRGIGKIGRRPRQLEQRKSRQIGLKGRKLR